MKDIIKMLSNSCNFYKRNNNLNLTFDEVGLLNGRSNEFLTQLKDCASQMILQNSLDAIALTDEMVEVQVLSFSEDVNKQYNGINEDNFLDKNLQHIRNKSENELEYIAKLRELVAKIQNMIDLLLKTKNDLNKLYNSLSIIEQNYNYIMETVERKRLYGSDALKYIKSVLNGRLSTHDKTKLVLKDTQALIDDLIADYNLIVAKVVREVEIVSDLNNFSKQKQVESEGKLFERL